MALSEKKKQSIIAAWKTGQYTKNALAKKHKISPSTLGIIVKGIPKSNKELLDKAIEVEEQKSKITKIEEKALEAEVQRHMKNAKLAESIIDISLQVTAKNIAKVHNDVDKKNLTARERTSHQRTTKMAIETAKLATEKPKEEEETPLPTTGDISIEEISIHVASLLPD